MRFQQLALTLAGIAIFPSILATAIPEIEEPQIGMLTAELAAAAVAKLMRTSNSPLDLAMIS